MRKILMAQNRKVSIVTPFFNESEAVTDYYHAIIHTLTPLNQYRFQILCVDDGSSDDTLFRLIQLSERDERLEVIELSRNFGKEAALSAGIEAATGDCVIPIDADLQDPPELIIRMLEEWEKGADVVLAKRIDRSSDTYAKRKTAALFYQIHNTLSALKIPDNVGDFRLMDRSVVDALKLLPERQRFMKGLFAWLGFKATTLEYVRNSRVAGESKFSGWKLWNFAIEGITSFSLVPLKIWTYIGGCGAIFAFFYASFIVVRTLIFGVDIPGYASLLVVTLFFGSLQLISLGVIGEYIGRIYFEAKQRPLYLIRKKYSKSF